MNAINNIANTSNTRIVIPGIGNISVPAYVELMKLLEGWENRENIFGAKFNSYFVPALASYLRATGRPYEANLVKEKAICHMCWSFENQRLVAVQFAKRWEKPGVYTLDTVEDEWFSYENEHQYHGEAAWEVIRDFCAPVVMNFR